MNPDELKELEAALGSSSSEEIDKIVTKFKDKRQSPEPEVEEIKKQLDPEQHDVFDEQKRPKKKIKADEGEDANAGTKTVTKDGKRSTIRLKFEEVARVGLSYQSKIINTAAAFAFGTPVKYTSDTKDTNELAVLDALKRVIHDNKMQYFDQDIAQELFGFTEVAELWYPMDSGTEHQNYGFPTKIKLKVSAFKPSKGDKLYPYFDATGDMIAFGRTFVVKVEGKDVDYFEVYTPGTVHQFKKTDGWAPVEGYPVKVSIDKIQIVYGNQDKPEYYPVQNIIKDDENLRSNFSDTNAYHADPTTVVKGKINGFSKKGQSGRVLEIGTDADVSLLESKNAAEGIKTQHLMNREDIFSLTQTPDVSFNSMKSIGQLGAAAQKLLFMDAHLKVKSKEIFLGPYLQRRINIIKAFIGDLNQKLKEASETVMISPEITPFIMGDDKETVDIVATAINGGFMSKKTGVQQLGWATDVEAELAQIATEEKATNTLNMFPPAQ